MVTALDRESVQPLHRQAYSGFRDAILRGEVAAGQQVPSSRALAAELGVSRFPVLDAYSQLLAEGYFESRIGAGTFVAASLPETRGQVRESSEGGETAGPRETPQRAKGYPAYRMASWPEGWRAFGVHQPALDEFPFEVWSKPDGEAQPGTAGDRFSIEERPTL